MRRAGAAPEVATSRVMAETLTLFYVLGGVTALLGVLGSEPDWPRRWVVVGLATTAIVSGAALGRWGPLCPRWFFHAPVFAGTALISLAALLAPDPVTAIVVAAIIIFIGVDVAFFFGRREGLVQLVLAIGLTTAALVARGDVPVQLGLAVNLVMTALGMVTRRLVFQASDASIDPLTGLANRRGFDERLLQLVARRDVLAAALIDLDHFKQVNDTYGHEAGDHVLCRVADLWRRALPSSAVLARHGGDEFALLLPGMTGPAALELVSRLRTLHPDIGLSIGVAQAGPGESAAQLLRRADTALYAAKAGGRGRCALAADDVPPASVPVVPGRA